MLPRTKTRPKYKFLGTLKMTVLVVRSGSVYASLSKTTKTIWLAFGRARTQMRKSSIVD
jgi:hypothetical protein